MATPKRKAPAGAKPSATTELNRLRLLNSKLERDNCELQQRCKNIEFELRLTYRDIRKTRLINDALVDALDREKYPATQAPDGSSIPF